MAYPADRPPIGSLKVDADTGKPLKNCPNVFRGISCSGARPNFATPGTLQIVDGWELSPDQVNKKDCPKLCGPCAAQADCVDGMYATGGGNGSFTCYSIGWCTPRTMLLTVSGVSPPPYNQYYGYCVGPPTATVNTTFAINSTHCVPLVLNTSRYFAWEYQATYPCQVTTTPVGGAIATTVDSAATINVGMFIDCRHLPAVAPADYPSTPATLMARVIAQIQITDGTAISFQTNNFAAYTAPDGTVLHGSGTTSGDYNFDDPYSDQIAATTPISQDLVNLWRNLYMGESNAVSSDFSYYNSHLSTGFFDPDFSGSGTATNKLTGDVITLAGSNGACSWPTHTDSNVYGGGGSATISFPTGDDCVDCTGLWHQTPPEWCVIVWMMQSYDNGQTWWWYRETPASSSSESSPSSLSSDSSSGSAFHTSEPEVELPSDVLSSGEPIPDDGTDYTLGAYYVFSVPYTDYPTSPIDMFSGLPTYYWKQWHVQPSAGNTCTATYYQVIGSKTYGRRCELTPEVLAARPERYAEHTPCRDNGSPSSLSSASSKSSASSASTPSSLSSASSASSNHHGGGGSVPDSDGGYHWNNTCEDCCDTLHVTFANPAGDPWCLLDVNSYPWDWNREQPPNGPCLWMGPTEMFEVGQQDDGKWRITTLVNGANCNVAFISTTAAYCPVGLTYEIEVTGADFCMQQDPACGGDATVGYQYTATVACAGGEGGGTNDCSGCSGNAWDVYNFYVCNGSIYYEELDLGISGDDPEVTRIPCSGTNYRDTGWQNITVGPVCPSGNPQASNYRRIAVCAGSAVPNPSMPGFAARRAVAADDDAELTATSRQKAEWLHEEAMTVQPPDMFVPISDEVRALTNRRVVDHNGLARPSAMPASAAANKPCLPCQRKRVITAKSYGLENS